MKLWHMRGFDKGPCDDAALVWADDPDEARDILKTWLAEHPDAVVSPQASGWVTIEVIPERGVWSVRGAQCGPPLNLSEVRTGGRQVGDDERSGKR